MSTDTIEKIGNTTIQHGSFNDRIYVIHLDPADCPEILSELESLAKKHGYSKIVGKIPEAAAKHFLENEFVAEARIPGYCHDGGDAFYMGRFLTEKRALEQAPDLVAEVLGAAKSKSPVSPKQALGYEPVVMTEADAPAMARLYATVFKSYPFAIDDPEFIISTMTNVRYYAMKKDGQLAALASADMDEHAKSVEMTDFATMPEHLGHGLALALLAIMDKDMAEMGYKTAFTIARSRSHGMNITFAKAGYEYRGTLVNNTNIHGDMESMNIWYKKL